MKLIAIVFCADARYGPNEVDVFPLRVWCMGHALFEGLCSSAPSSVMGFFLQLEGSESELTLRTVTRMDENDFTNVSWVVLSGLNSTVLGLYFGGAQNIPKTSNNDKERNEIG